MKSDLGISTTCLAVFDDGRFHMEHLSKWPASDPRIFEDSLPNEDFKSLSTILDAQELKRFKTVQKGEKGLLVVRQGEIVHAIIPRAETTQEIIANALEGSGGQVFKPLPAPLSPLVDWLHATTKSVSQRKLKPLKKVKPVNCWMGPPLLPY